MTNKNPIEQLLEDWKREESMGATKLHLSAAIHELETVYEVSKPQLTEEMCDVLGEHVYDNYGPGDQETMYRALEAVFAIAGKK